MPKLAMTLFFANINTIPNAAMKDAVIRTRVDGYETQFQETHILEGRNCDIDESWSDDLDVK